MEGIRDSPIRGRRHASRRRALELLYALDINGLPYEEGEADFLGASAQRRKGWSDFAHDLASRTWRDREALDRRVEGALHKWKIERLPTMDRLCLRMALCELAEFEDIPLRVTLNEYIELARLFGAEDSPSYINGVLDRLARDFPAKADPKPDPKPEPEPEPEPEAPAQP